MQKRKAALIIAPEAVADQIHAWLIACGLEAAQIDLITVPRDCVNILRSGRYDLILAAQRLMDVRGYPWYQALRALAPRSRIVLFGMGENGLPALYAAEEVDREFGYLAAGINEGDVEAFVSALQLQADREIASGIPSFDNDHYQQCEKLIKSLKDSVGAHLVYLVDNFGQVLTGVGQINASTISELASLLGGGFAALLEVGKVLGEHDSPMNLIYRQGEHDDLYALGLSPNFSIVLLIARGPYTTKIGTVWYYTQKTAEALKDILAELSEPASLESFPPTDLDATLNNLFGPAQVEDEPAPSGPALSADEALQQGLISEDFVKDNPLFKRFDTGQLGPEAFQ